MTLAEVLERSTPLPSSPDILSPTIDRLIAVYSAILGVPVSAAQVRQLVVAAHLIATYPEPA